jgi:uncharacterized membrane protein YcaP (DUF421 family)/DNA-directed RNA polymerase subunit RPC12/RpoP
MDQAIDIFDWQRMLLGDQPPLFLLEILFRTIIIYVYTLALLRWLGSRTIGQLSTVEFLLVIALGSAVGDAMFYPDVPLVHALVVVTIVVLANKGLDILIARFKTAERAIDGVPEEIIRDGVFCKEFFKSTSMGPSEAFQELRERGIEHLGQVARAYVESDGGMTAYLAKEHKPGLPIVPPWELEHPERLYLPLVAQRDAHISCFRCGETFAAQKGQSLAACRHCGHDHFTYARTELLFASPEQG